MRNLVSVSPFTRLVAAHVVDVNFAEPKPVLPRWLKGDVRKTWVKAWYYSITSSVVLAAVVGWFLG